MVEEKFIKLIEKHKIEINKYNSISDKIGYLRLGAIISAGYFIYKIVKVQYSFFNVAISGVFFLIFGGLVIYHGKMKEKIKVAEAMIEINNRYLKRVSGEWTDFEDIGEEFEDKDHPYSSDLDIIGHESVFQLINITSTWKGRETLAKALLQPEYTLEEIQQRQQGVEELKNNLELCQSMEYEGKRKQGAMESPETLLKFISEKSKLFKSNSIKYILYAIPMITIPVSVTILVFNMQQLNDLIKIFIVIQLLIWALGLRRISKAFGAISYYKEALNNYVGILTLLEKENFKSKVLSEIHSRLFEDNKSAVIAMRELNNIAERINMRNNDILFLVLNGLFLWDYQCVFSMENWSEKYGHLIEGWLKDIGELEALMSISVLNHIAEEAVFPSLVKEITIFEAEDLGHPLIPKEVRVNNSINLDKSIFIITGSNMSGKTTFLRTIGINLVITYCGGAVCCKNMRCSRMKLYTSMRITDDLKAGISTFYGELIRIKEIVQAAGRKEDMIFLIDEIFRGTNSRDRIEGAQSVIKNLNKNGVIGAMTTHDLEVCNLNSNEKVKNYHFEEYYKDNKIYFDYKLKEGVSTTTNAKFLMKIVGIQL